LPQTSGTNTASFSPTQGGSIDFAGGKGITPVTPTSTGFQAGANGTFTGNASAWNSPAVTQHSAAQGTNVNPNQAMTNELNQAKTTLQNMQSSLSPTPPETSAPTNLNQGATTGGGQPFQGNYTFDSQGNVTGQSSAPSPYAKSLGTDPNASNQTSSSPAGNTSAQTNAIIKSLQDAASQGSSGDAGTQALINKIQELQSNYGTQLGNITGSEMPQAFETGAANVLTSQYGPQLQGLTQALGALQANRTASLTAGANAAGASNTLQGLQQQNQAISPGQSLYNL